MSKHLVGILVVFGWSLFLVAGCEERSASFETQSDKQGDHSKICRAKATDNSTELLEKVAQDQALYATSQPESTPIGPASGVVSFSSEEVRRYLPDPVDIDMKLNDIARELQVKLSLEECITSCLENNFKIKTEGYGPAISAMDILKSESNFDAVFFAEAKYDTKDQPPAVSELAGDLGSKSDERTLSTGLTKFMSTGATVTGAYNLVRYDGSALDNYKISSIYTSNFLVELRQPLLRGFGVDFNRAGIDSSKNSTKIAKYQYRRTVRDVLFDVEKAYWALVQARRDVVIQRTLIDQTKETYKYLKQREDYDVYSVQITRVSSLLGTRIAQYIQIRNTVRDAEDQLKSLMNDPKMNLGEDVEIIPTDFPTLGPVVLDRLSEVQAALECRSELEEAKLQIENARINVMVMKNQALPKFDLTFQYVLNGIAMKAGSAFDQMSTSNYQDYFVGLRFEYPIGNRGPRSDMRKAVLQRDQAIAGLKQVIEGVILEVDVAVRNLQTAYYQVPPSKGAVEAAEKNVEAIIARMTRMSPEYLDVQLSAQETLAVARRGLLNALVNYNVALVQLEKAKDTLLQYDNVTINAECE